MHKLSHTGLLFFLVILFSSIINTFAQNKTCLYIEEIIKSNISGNDITITKKSYYDNDIAAYTESYSNTRIIHHATGNIYIVNDRKKEYITINAEEYSKSQPHFNQPNAKNIKIQETGSRKIQSGFNCIEYMITGINMAYKSYLWITNEDKISFKNYLSFLQKNKKSSDPIESLLLKTRSIVISRNTIIKGQDKKHYFMNSRVKKLELILKPETLFTIPEGYKKASKERKITINEE